MYYTRTEIDFQFMLNQPKLDCIYHFQTILEPNGMPFGFKSIENGIHNLISVDLTRTRSSFL